MGHKKWLFTEFTLAGYWGYTCSLHIAAIQFFLPALEKTKLIVRITTRDAPTLPSHSFLNSNDFTALPQLSSARTTAFRALIGAWGLSIEVRCFPSLIFNWVLESRISHSTRSITELQQYLNFMPVFSYDAAWQEVVDKKEDWTHVVVLLDNATSFSFQVRIFYYLCWQAVSNACTSLWMQVSLTCRDYISLEWGGKHRIQAPTDK